MKIQAYLSVKSNGSIKITKSSPSLDWDEIAIKLNVDIPNEIFRKPRLEASITIPKEAAAPELISSEVIDNIKDAVKSVSGYELKITVESENKELVK